MYSTIDKNNALEFFNRYLERKNSALEELRIRCEASNGPTADDLDFSSASLIPLWLWFRRSVQITTVKPIKRDMTLWYEAEIINHRMNEGLFFEYETAQNIDGLAYYWGETLIKNIPDMNWEIGAYRNSLGFCKPVVQSNYFSDYPLQYAIFLAQISQDPEDFRNVPTLLSDTLQNHIDTEKRYRQNYIKNSGHLDPRMKRKTIFK